MTLSIPLSISHIRNLLIKLIFLFVGLHIAFQYLSFFTPYDNLVLIQRFNLDEEISIPTWFSQIELLIAAGLFALLARQKALENKPAIPWFGLATIFLYLSIDEGSMLHEGLITPLQNAFEVSDGPFGFAWVLVGIPLLTLIFALYLPFLIKLSLEFKWSILYAALIYVGGALGVEMIGAQYLALGGGEIGYAAIVTIEETMQMAGIAVLIVAQLRYLQKNTSTIRIEIQ